MLDLLENHTASKAVLDTLDPNASIDSKLLQSSTTSLTPLSLTSRSRLHKKEESSVSKPFNTNNNNNNNNNNMNTSNSSSDSTGSYEVFVCYDYY
jgi:hypothetical protein